MSGYICGCHPLITPTLSNGSFLYPGGSVEVGTGGRGAGKERRGGGRAPGIAAASLLCSSYPSPSCPQDEGAALEICPVKGIKHVSAKTIFQMGINFSHGAPARLVPEELTAHQ